MGDSPFIHDKVFMSIYLLLFCLSAVHLENAHLGRPVVRSFNDDDDDDDDDDDNDYDAVGPVPGPRHGPQHGGGQPGDLQDRADMWRHLF